MSELPDVWVEGWMNEVRDLLREIAANTKPSAPSQSASEAKPSMLYGHDAASKRECEIAWGDGYNKGRFDAAAPQGRVPREAIRRITTAVCWYRGHDDADTQAVRSWLASAPADAEKGSAEGGEG